MKIVIYVILACVGCVQLYQGRKTKRTLQHQVSKRINPYSIFSKSESLLFTNKSAKIIAYGFMFNGISILSLIIGNFVFNLVDPKIMFLLSMIIIIVSALFTYHKAFMYFEE